MRVLMVGDVVGRPGRKACQEALPKLRKELGLDLIVVNAENSAGGFGVTEKTAKELLTWGADVLTTGNHVWDKRETSQFILEMETLLRPANYPPGTPGAGMYTATLRGGQSICVINLSGRIYMEALDCPFRKVDDLLEEVNTPIVLVDFHAEATSEKIAMGWYLDGRASVVVGTHTHVPTADERILPQGTAYITDLGMTGPVDSVLGVEKEIIVEKFLTHMPARFEVASGLTWFSALMVEIDEATGHATRCERIRREYTF